jgi:hypothetical protein
VSREKWVSQVPPWTDATGAQRQLLDATWRLGELAFLLTPSQLDSHSKIRAWEQRGQGRVFALDISRRWGKSVLCVVLAMEDAIKYPRFRIVYCAPTYEQVRKIVVPLFALLTLSCPPPLRPEWLKSEGVFQFPNGSRIELIGLDQRPDGARGTGVDKVVLDESAFYDNLEYLLVSILYPQMLGRDHARIIAASTPPVTPAHYWSEVVVPKAVSADAHDRKTLDDADQYSDEEIEFFYSEMPGGRRGTAARREYGAEHLPDATLAIIPEFAEMEKEIVRDVYPPPVWRDCYVSLDPGYHDLSAVLFGYWHFEANQLIVEDEIAAPRLNSRELANLIKARERVLWSQSRRRGHEYSTLPQPYLRISDNNPRLLADLAADHQLQFIATQKDNLVQQVDQVRVAVQQGRIIIHPRCKKLCSHLRHGVWKKVGALFGREDGFGHFDTIAALVYLWRNVQKRRNPMPKLERFVCADLRVTPDNDNRERARATSKWAGGAKWRRDGNRYFIRTGRLDS